MKSNKRGYTVLRRNKEGGIVIQTKVVLPHRKVVPAILYGANKGDVSGGSFYYNKKWINMDKLPKGMKKSTFFPFKRTVKTPFIDL